MHIVKIVLDMSELTSPPANSESALSEDRLPMGLWQEVHQSPITASNLSQACRDRPAQPLRCTSPVVLPGHISTNHPGSSDCKYPGTGVGRVHPYTLQQDREPGTGQKEEPFARMHCLEHKNGGIPFACCEQECGNKHHGGPLW